MPSTSASPAPAAEGYSQPLPQYVSIAFLIAVIAAMAISVTIMAQRSQPKTIALGDKDLEAARIAYGFWLIVCALVLTLAILIVVLTAIAPAAPKSTDVVALITATTGVIGTLVAAFFGIQAAGAGRSQALSALSDQIKSQAGDTAATPSKMDPQAGPPAGGTRVSITGNGFNGATKVNFGTLEADHFELLNDGLVRANSPQTKATGSVKVSIIYPNTTPSNKEVGTFYYYDIQPSHGDAAATTPVTITGTGLKAANAVKFGNQDGKINAATETSLTVDAPTGTKSTDVPVVVHYPVSSPTSTFVVGQYHYD